MGIVLVVRVNEVERGSLSGVHGRLDWKDVKTWGSGIFRVGQHAGGEVDMGRVVMTPHCAIAWGQHTASMLAC